MILCLWNKEVFTDSLGMKRKGEEERRKRGGMEVGGRKREGRGRKKRGVGERERGRGAGEEGEGEGKRRKEENDEELRGGPD